MRFEAKFGRKFGFWGRFFVFLIKFLIFGF